MSVASLSRASLRVWTLVLGLLAALVLQATPAFAGTVTLTVNRTGHRWGGITDDQQMLNCQTASACSATYDQYCETDPETHMTLCDPVEIELTTSLPTGFAAEWFDCATFTATTCSVSVGSFNGAASGKTVTVNYVDTEAPTLSLLAPSEGGVYRTAISTWAFPSDNDQIARVRFTYGPVGQAGIVVDDTTAPFTAPLSTSGLPDGPFTVVAQAFDRSGQGSATVQRNVLVDRVAPEVALSGPGDATTPGPWLRGGQVRSWDFSASDATSGVKSITCAVDGAAPAACGEPASHSLTPAAGAHSIAVTATDGGNNSTTVTRYFQVDDTAPALSLPYPARDATIKDKTPTFTPSASDVESGIASVTCQIGTSAAEACDDFAPTLADGTHTVKVRATNGVGLSRQISRTFTVDTTAPATTITNGPDRPFALASTAVFGLAAGDPTATFQCRLDGAAFAGCTSPRQYSGLAAGTHTVNARATDAVGNADKTPATWTWTVPHDDRNLTFTAAWTGLQNSKYFRGTALRATAKNAALVRKDVRALRLALVATSCDGCGTVDVLHGTTLLKRVSLDSDTTQHRRVFAVKAYDALSTAANVRIVVASSGKPVIIDGLGIATR